MVRGAIINDPEDTTSGVVRGLGHHPFHQLVEGQDAICVLNLTNDCASKAAILILELMFWLRWKQSNEGIICQSVRWSTIALVG